MANVWAALYMPSSIVPVNQDLPQTSVSSVTSPSNLPRWQTLQVKKISMQIWLRVCMAHFLKYVVVADSPRYGFFSTREKMKNVWITW